MRGPVDRNSSRPVRGSACTTLTSKFISLLLLITLPCAELMP
jgi:hypothetical protein